jgi:hypothetical protein
VASYFFIFFISGPHTHRRLQAQQICARAAFSLSGTPAVSDKKKEKKKFNLSNALQNHKVCDIKRGRQQNPEK